MQKGLLMRSYARLKKEFDVLQEKYIRVFGEKEELSYELSGLKSKAEEVRSQEAQIRALHENVRHLKHDMKNHLMVLASYLNSSDLEAAKAYTSEILDKLNSVHSYIETGNSLLNHILNEKLVMARKKGIGVKAEVETLSFEKMGSLDFSALFSNMLDNALEASLKEPEKQREIQVAVTAQRGYETIVVKNRISRSVLVRNPTLASDKAEPQNHGMGIPQIKEIVEKYNGMYDFYEEDGWFCAGAFIPE